MKYNLLLTIILSILLTSYTSAQTKISAKSGKLSPQTPKGAFISALQEI